MFAAPRIVKPTWTKRDLLKASEDPGRPRRQLGGTYIGDMIALKKALQFCATCSRKFEPAKAGYISKRNIPFVRGKCDGCGDHHDRMRLLVHHTLASGL